MVYFSLPIKNQVAVQRWRSKLQISKTFILEQFTRNENQIPKYVRAIALKRNSLTGARLYVNALLQEKSYK